jgi:hypothetical protein
MELPIKTLPILIGLLRQEKADGELALEQNDGVRRLYFSRGELVHLESEVAGEKFGSLLLRQGILDLPSLNGILADKASSQIGEKAIQSGFMSLQERDAQFQALQEQIMVHALEHPVLHGTWSPTPPGLDLDKELDLKLPYRNFVWHTFQEAHYLTDLLLALEAETAWRWEAPRDLLDRLGDLPLTPNTAYALSFLGADPISFETFSSLSDLDREEAGRLIAILWALGALTLTGGALRSLTGAAFREAIHRPAQPSGARLAQDPPLDMDLGNLELEILEFDPEPEPDRRPRLQAPAAAHQPPSAREAPAPRSPRPPAAPPPGMTGRPDPFSRSEIPRLPAADPRAARRDPAPQAAPAQKPAPPPAAASREAAPGPRQPAIELAPKAQVPKEPSPFDEAPPALPPPPILTGPARARVLLTQAKQQVHMDRTVEAIRTLEQAVQLGLEGDFAYEAWFMLGQLRLANPAWSTRAIDALQQAADLRPKAAAPWALMGELYHRKGFEANAATCYRRVLGLDATYPVPPDVDMDATDAPAAPAPASGRDAVFDKVRKLFGGSRKA